MNAPRLRVQLAVGNALTAFALVCVVTVLLTSRSDDLRRAEAETGTQRDAMVLAAQVASHVRDLDDLKSLVSQSRSRLDEIVGPNGARLVGADLMGNTAVARAAAAALDDSEVSAGRSAAANSRDAIGAQPIVVDGSLRAAALVLEPLPARRGWRQMYGLDVPAALAVALLASVIGWWLAGRISRPLDRLTTQARTLALEGRASAIPSSRIPEIATLAAAMDRLGDRVGRDAEHRHRIDAHLRRVSHELRTPLTTIRLRVEDPTQPGFDGEATGVILGQLDRLERLGNDLDEIRLDRVATSAVDLVAVVADTANRLRPLADWARIDLRVDATGPVVVDGEAGPLGDVVVNLIENGLKYTPPGGQVRASVCDSADAAQIEVADTGPGIAAELVDTIVRPGVRASGDRTVPGSGQGLAIVAATVDRHGGTLELASTPTGGALIRVTLPKRSAADPVEHVLT